MNTPGGGKHSGAMASMSYASFGWMIAASMVVMFGLMYLNTFSLDHVFFSETRPSWRSSWGRRWRSSCSRFMWRMYPSTRREHGHLAVAAVFGVSLWLVRSQATVSDLAYMRAMIPHHSIAILTSGRAQITDPRVRKLADGIIATQRKEIGEMQAIHRRSRRGTLRPASPPSANTPCRCRRMRRPTAAR